MLRRELALVLGAPVTWLVAALAALLVGHSFILAIDIFSAASQSALSQALQQREMDPLLGVVRPCLGGLHLAAALLLPIAAVRSLSIEKERHSYGSVVLRAGASEWVVATKGLALLSLVALFLIPCVILCAAFVAAGGHLDAAETAVALFAHLLHLVAVSALALLCAAVTDTFAQAAALALSASLLSWAIEAGEGFSALAWLGNLDWLSVSQRLEPFEHGVLSWGGMLWLLAVTLAGFAAALLLSAPVRERWRLMASGVVAGGAALLLSALASTHAAVDLSEARRNSLPEETEQALRSIAGPIELEVFLDREDGRRTQLANDALVKLYLARPDLKVSFPTDSGAIGAGVSHDDAYGWIIVHVGAAVRQTRSTSRRELTTLMFEAAGVAGSDASPTAYLGYPLVPTGAARAWLGALAYAVVPGLMVAVGIGLVQRRRRS